MDMENQAFSPPHIAIIPSPGMGHLIPLCEFAKRLVHHHNFAVTFIIPTDGPPSRAQKSVLQALPSKISHTFLPPVNFDDLREDTAMETRITLMVTRSLTSISEAVASLTEGDHNNLVALVVDLFGTDAFSVAREFNILPYVFFPSTAMALSLFLYLPELDKAVSGEYRDSPELIKIPGCIPIHGRDLLDPLQDKSDDAYKHTLQNAKMYRSAEGIMVNSFMDLEPDAIKSLQESEPGKPRIYPVGPLINIDPSVRPDESEILKWLDDQPRGSVLFVSFGSGGTLSLEQLTELAFGLEMSEQRFLWVVRSPNNQQANATYFGAQSVSDPLSFLPKDFLERIQGKSVVVPNWAPQAQILGHASTGGFLTHCGWNSSLESVVNGVPLIAWPLYAEQRMNAVMLAEDVKVALRLTSSGDEGGLIEKEEIARVVKSLMEGEEGKKVRFRMKELKDSAVDVLSKGGSSTKALSELAHMWRNNQKST